MAKNEKYVWNNWSGSQSAEFSGFTAPSSEDEITQVIQQSVEKSLPIKFVGSSHSFSPIIADNASTLLSLENYSGIVDLDTDNRTVRVKAGTTIHELSRKLWDAGWALENLGDIEEQTVGGAICTGTHGTGIQYQNLAGFIREMTLVSPDRGKETFSPSDPEFASIAVVSFAFGLVTEYVLDIVPRYHLELNMFPSTMSRFQENFQEWVYKNRNSEIFWFPGTESTLIKLTNLVECKEFKIKNKRSEFISDYIENKVFGVLNKINKSVPASNGVLKRILEKLLPTTTTVDRSYKVYATERKVKFQETEWSLPISSLFDVIDDMRDVVGTKEFRTLFPIEFRFVKRDNLDLSPSYGEEHRVYIAAHTYFQDAFYLEYFRRLQEIFLRHGGRPHWGKMFSATQDDFQGMYPNLDRVRLLRHSFDSQSLLPTSTLKNTVFGVSEFSQSANLTYSQKIKKSV